MAQEQNTNSLAYQQLRPLENDNVGLLLEERNRWWRKYKDDQDAEKARQEAAKAKVLADQKNERDKDIQKLSAPDATLWFQDQVLTDYDENVSKQYAEYRRLYNETGENVYKTKADIIWQKQKNLNETKQNVIDTSKYYAEQAAKRNKYTDPDKLEELGTYANWEYLIKNQDIGTYDKEGKLVFESPSEFQTNKLAKIPYSGVPDFKADALKIKALVDTAKNNGEIRPGETEATKIREAVESYFNNDVNYRTWAGEKKYINEKTGLAWTTEELNKNAGTKDLLVDSWIKTHIQLEKSTDGLTNALKAENLKAARKSNQKEEVTISLATTEEGARVGEFTLGGKKVSLTQNDRVFNVNNGDVTISEFKGDKQSGVQVDGIIVREDGTILATGQKIKQKRVAARDEAGNIIYDVEKRKVVEDGREVEKEFRVERVATITEYAGNTVVGDKVEVNKAVKAMDNPKTGKKYKDLAEFAEHTEELAPTIKTDNAPVKRRVYKGVDVDGNPIFVEE